MDKFISTLDAKKNPKLNKTELTSLLSATTLKINLAFVKDEIKIKGKWKERKLVVNVF